MFCKKDEPDRAELYQHWQERFASQELAESVEGISRSRLSAEKAEALEISRADQQPAADRATAYALAHLEERHITFSPQKLMEQALSMNPGLTGFDEIMNSFEDLRCSGRLVDGRSARGDPVLTTDHAIRTEQDIITRLETSSGQGKSLVKPEAVDIHLQDTALNHGQQQAINLVLESEDRIVGIQGTAGSGKTRMLGEMRSIAEGNGIQVLGLAPTASAARTLEAESNIPSVTLQSFLLRHEDIANGTATAERVTGVRSLFRDTILVIDEASLIGLVQMRDLVRIAERLDLPRLALVGDSRQLNGVEAGAPFRQMQYAGMEVARMATIMRQRDPLLRDAVEKAALGEPVAALEMLRDNVFEVERNHLESRAVEYWLGLEDKDRAETLLMAPMRWQRDEINHLIREARTEAGELTGEGISITRLESCRMTRVQKQQPENYHLDDAVVFAVDSPRAGIKAHEIYNVTGHDRDFVYLRDRQENTTRFDPGGGKMTRLDIASRLDVFEPVDMDIRQGDILRWTRNDRERNLLNATTASVIAVEADSLVIKTDDDRVLRLNADDRQLAHCNYGYASTVHAAQGLTADRVIAVLGTDAGKLTDQKTFYVEISRARDEAIIITDDRLELADTLAATSGEQISALEAIDKDIGKDNDGLEKETAPSPKIETEQAVLADVDHAEDLSHEHDADKEMESTDQKDQAHDQEHELSYELELELD